MKKRAFFSTVAPGQHLKEAVTPKRTEQTTIASRSRKLLSFLLYTHPSLFSSHTRQNHHPCIRHLFCPHLPTGPANDGKMISVARDPPQALERRGRHPAAAAALPGSSTARSGRVPPAGASVVVALLPRLPLALPAPARSSPRKAGDKHRLCQRMPRLRAAGPLALLSAACQVDEARERGVRDSSFRSVPRRRRRRGLLGAAAVLFSLSVGGVPLAAAPGVKAAGGGGAVVEAGDGLRWVRLSLVLVPEVVDREEVDTFEALGHAEDALQVRADAQAPYLRGFWWRDKGGGDACQRAGE